LRGRGRRIFVSSRPA
jgi:hypothetical protein